MIAADSNTLRTMAAVDRLDEGDARDVAQRDLAAAMWASLQRDPAPYATEAGHFADFHLSESRTADLIGAVAKMRLKDGLQSMYAQAIVNTVTKIVEKLVENYAFAEALASDSDREDFDARR